MRFLRLLFIFSALVSSSSFIYSQNTKIDSLKNELKKPLHDTTSTGIYVKIANYMSDLGIESDSVFSYADKIIALADKNLPQEVIPPIKDSISITFIKHKAKAHYIKGYNYLNIGEFNEAIPLLEKSIEIHTLIKNYSDIGSCYTPLGIIQYALGNYEGAIEYFTKGLDIFIELDDQTRIATSNNNIGIIYRHQGLYDKAVEHYMKSLKVYEEVGHKEGEGKSHNNIAIIYNYQKNYNLAIEHYSKALKIFESINDKREINRINNNLGIVYSNMAEDEKEDEQKKKQYYDKALNYYEESLKNAKELNDKVAVSACLSNMGSIYKELGLFSKALQYLSESLKIDKEMGDVAGMATVHVRLAEVYNAMAKQIINSEDDSTRQLFYTYVDKAIDFSELSYKTSLEIGSYPIQRSALLQLMTAWKYKGDNSKALLYSEKYIEVNEFIYNDERSKALAEMQSKYEAEKKALEIENLNKENSLRIIELAHSEEQRKKQITIIYSFIIVFTIIILFSIIITRLFLQKKKANIVLAEQRDHIQEQNIMLQEAMEEIRAQKEEIESQHETVVKQKIYIEEQKYRIDDSIRYAQRIQSAVLPTDSIVSKLFDEYFILYLPKDVVSGDFYWASESGEWIILAAADCTGHGVPGAFMSMLGMSFLNQITATKKFTNASDTLFDLRKEIIKALRQSEDDDDSQLDGMDISLAAINKNTLKCHWAGANSPIWIIKNSYDDDSDEIIEEIKGDKMPVGIYIKMDKFTNHEIQLKKGDKLYLFSDGYADQFGGREKKKFNKKALKSLLSESASLPMSKQKEILEAKLYEWKNPEQGIQYDQIDDIVFMGIKI
ncbi:MAG: tetratricopeptide repeat protein [Bacteroidetes bacterium]|nr:tetratricopeptide repeat protein [Bacteroidota bacterium]